jgi:ankyrin repeat protein
VEEKGADVNIVNHNGASAVFGAVRSSNEEILKFLVAKGANVNILTLKRATPLVVAVTSKSLSIVEFLLNNEADFTALCEDGITALMIAIVSGCSLIADKLIKKYTATEKAAQLNIQSSKGHTALLLAAALGNLPIVQELLKAGAVVDIPDKDGDTALLMACQGDKKSHLEIAKLLIEKKAAVNFRNNNGVTCLHRATFNNNVDMLNILLAHGANVNAKNVIKQYPLHLAAEKGLTEIAELLIQEKCDREVKNDKNWTSLMLAAYKNKTDVLKLLLRKGTASPKVDEVEDQGDTALTLASQEGAAGSVIALLNFGADRSIKNKKGFDAATIAR